MLNLFFSDSQYDFQIGLSMEYINKVLNQTIILYEVDLQKTNRDSIYGETKPNQIVFRPPVELHVMYEIQPRRINVI